MDELTDWADITWHSLPTAAVGIAMGFMAAFGIQSATSFEMWCWLLASLIGLLAFSLMWARREQRQHGGHMGGKQSWLEALIPVIVGPLFYVASTFVFMKLPI